MQGVKMKKLLKSMLFLGVLGLPAFSEVKWDLDLDTEYEKIVYLAQEENNHNDLEIESKLQVDIENSLDNGLDVGLILVTASGINEAYENSSDIRIMRLHIGYRF